MLNLNWFASAGEALETRLFIERGRYLVVGCGDHLITGEELCLLGWGHCLVLIHMHNLGSKFSDFIGIMLIVNFVGELQQLRLVFWDELASLGVVHRVALSLII